MRANATLAAVSVAAVAVAALLLPGLTADTPGWRPFLALLPVVVGAQLVAAPRLGGNAIVLSGAGLVAVALLVPPELAVLAGVAPAAQLAFHTPWRQVAHAVCANTLAVAAASATAHALLEGEEPGRFALAGVAAAAAFALVDNGLTLARIAFKTRQVPRETLRAFALETVVPQATLAALGVVVAWLWYSNLLLVPFAIVALALLSRAVHVPQLEEEARIDGKTGLANARQFHHVFQQELGRAARYDRPLTLILADLDHLREINNEHGHLTGDLVLRGISDVFRAQLRRMDTAARFGGEEFCILLPETTLEQGIEVAERIRKVVARQIFDADGSRVRATLSLGVAAYPEDGWQPEELIRHADEALFRAKDAGRNCVRPASLVAA